MRTLLLGLALSVIPCVSFAQDKVTLREIEFYQQTVAGEPTVCGTEYTYLFEDRSYKKGALAGFNGTLAWTVHGQGTFGALFKIGAMDFPNGPAKPPVMFPINAASIKVGNTTLRPKQYACEMQNGSFCGGFGGDDAIVLYLSMRGQPTPATIQFNRVKSGLDYGFDLKHIPDPSQNMDKYRSEYEANQQCMMAIMKRSVGK